MNLKLFWNYFVDFAMVMGFDLKIKKSVRRVVVPLNILIIAAFWFYEKSLHTNWFFLFCASFIALYFIYTMYCIEQESGFSKWLKRTFSAEKALLIHRAIFNQLCFLYGSAVAAIATITPNTLFSANILLVKVIGVVFMVVGFVSKALAVRAVGFGPYFYQEIFEHDTKFSFISSGIYKYIQNPMYSLGYLQGYGVCLYYNSKTALGVMIVSHILVYYFYLKVEKPYIKMVISKLPQLDRGA